MILKNVELFWARLDPEFPARYEGTPDSLGMQVRTRDKDVAAEWKSTGLGVKVDEDDDGVFYRMNVKRFTQTKDGKPMTPPAVVGRDLMPFEDPGKIGNGTIANVKITPYEYTFNGNKGVSSRLDAVQIVKLEEYIRKDSQEPNFGFTALDEVSEPKVAKSDEVY